MYRVYSLGKFVVSFDDVELARKAVHSLGGKYYIDYSEEALALINGEK